MLGLSRCFQTWYKFHVVHKRSINVLVLFTCDWGSRFFCFCFWLESLVLNWIVLAEAHLVGLVNWWHWSWAIELGVLGIEGLFSRILYNFIFKSKLWSNIGWVVERRVHLVTGCLTSILTECWENSVSKCTGFDSAFQQSCKQDQDQACAWLSFRKKNYYKNGKKITREKS